MARAALGWSREALAEKSGVPAITTKQFENGDTDPRLSTLHKWRRALEARGVIFIEANAKSDEGGEGVRFKSARRASVEGVSAMKQIGITTIVRFRKSKVVSHVKGHEVYCVEEDQDAGKPYPIYRYKDDKTLVPEEGNAQRACKLCKKKPTADGHDPCLGHLPGVIAACCGHGADDGYLSFRNGIILRFAPAVVEKCETNATPKTGNDEFLGALAERLAARADTAEAAGDDEMAVQMRAASEAVHATEFLRMALSAMESAHYEWDKFKR